MIWIQDNMPAMAILLPTCRFTSSKQFTKRWTQEIALHGFYMLTLRRVSILSITIFEKRTGLSKNRENITQVVIETCLYHRFIDEIIETCIAIHVCKGLVKKYRGEGAFGNVVDKKHIAHPLPAAQK